MEKSVVVSSKEVVTKVENVFDDFIGMNTKSKKTGNLSKFSSIQVLREIVNDKYYENIVLVLKDGKKVFCKYTCVNGFSGCSTYEYVFNGFKHKSADTLDTVKSKISQFSSCTVVSDDFTQARRLIKEQFKDKSGQFVVKF